MKRTLLFIALILGVGNFTFAQSNQTAATKNNAAVKANAEEHIDKKIQKLTKALSLTAQQQASVKQIMEQTVPAIKAARQAKDRIKAKQIVDNMHKQVAAVLNSEQKMKFERLIAEQNAKRENTQKGKTN